MVPKSPIKKTILGGNRLAPVPMIGGKILNMKPDVLKLKIRDVPRILDGRRPRTASGVQRILDEYAQELGYDYAQYFTLDELTQAGIISPAWAARARKLRAGHLRRHFGTRG